MKYIRDPIYGYVPLSPLENKLISQPSVLRLHKVLQNSTVYLTYPNDSSVRFSHSIGAMHLAGRLFKSIFNNADPQLFSRITDSARNYLLKTRNKLTFLNAKRYLLQLQQRGDEKQDSFYMELGWQLKNKEAKLVAADYNLITNNILFQGIRLAALVHDIGHLPYSHIGSYAIEDTAISFLGEKNSNSLLNGIYALDKKYFALLNQDGLFTTPGKKSVSKGDLHERIGLVLLDEIYQTGIEVEDFERDFNELCLSIAFQIIVVHQFGHVDSSVFRAFLKDNAALGIWYPLGSIISGPVDCDRLDYIIRDAYNSGAQEMVSFDQDRIINSVSLSKRYPDKKYNASKNPLIPVFDRRALSALTDFFHTRMRLFRWVTNHHNVVRTDLVLLRLLSLLISVFEAAGESKLKTFLFDQKFNKLWDYENLTTEYRYIDDSWIEQILLKLYKEFGVHFKESDNSQVRECKTLLRVFLDRKVDLLVPLWKRENGFLDFAEGFSWYLRNKVDLDSIVNLKIKKEIEEAKLVVSNIQATNLILGAWARIEGRSPYSCMIPIETEISNILGLNIYLVFKRFGAYKTVEVQENFKKIITLEKMSTLVSRLDSIFQEGLMLYAYQIIDGQSDVKALDLINLGENICQIVIQLFNKRGAELKKVVA